LGLLTIRPQDEKRHNRSAMHPARQTDPGAPNGMYMQKPGAN